MVRNFRAKTAQWYGPLERPLVVTPPARGPLSNIPDAALADNWSGDSRDYTSENSGSRVERAQPEPKLAATFKHSTTTTATTLKKN